MIETRRSGQLQHYIDQLLHLAGVREPPVPVEQIAQLRGARIRYVAFDGELAGLLFEEQGQIIIGVNMSHPKTRQRFTIAHELGHLELHHLRAFHIDRNFRAVSTGKAGGAGQASGASEVEANAFAAELLMPAALLLQDVQGYPLDYEGDALLATLAERYLVSPQAMLLRLTALGVVRPF